MNIHRWIREKNWELKKEIFDFETLHGANRHSDVTKSIYNEILRRINNKMITEFKCLYPLYEFDANDKKYIKASVRPFYIPTSHQYKYACELIVYDDLIAKLSKVYPEYVI